MLSQERPENGWGGGTRTPACKDQNLVPYQLGDTPMIIFRRLARLRHALRLCHTVPPLRGHLFRYRPRFTL